jgi:hypothetical protein
VDTVSQGWRRDHLIHYWYQPRRHAANRLERAGLLLVALAKRIRP